MWEVKRKLDFLNLMQAVWRNYELPLVGLSICIFHGRPGHTKHNAISYSICCLLLCVCTHICLLAAVPTWESLEYDSNHWTTNMKTGIYVDDAFVLWPKSSTTTWTNNIIKYNSPGRMRMTTRSVSWTCWWREKMESSRPQYTGSPLTQTDTPTSHHTTIHDWNLEQSNA